jgi:sarcosine oxidase gamma subunit
MAGRKVLVVATTDADEAELGDELAGADQIRVVTPAAQVSTLAWLTGDEDEQRAEARETAERVAEAVGGEVDPTSHNTDAAQDVDDALRVFGPDEIVVVTRPGTDKTWLEDEALQKAVKESGVPVRHIELAATE